eukprot:m51a1_g9085 hypothetical protein (141) ;mRNA; r:36850-39361
MLRRILPRPKLEAEAPLESQQPEDPSSNQRQNPSPSASSDEQQQQPQPPQQQRSSARRAPGAASRPLKKTRTMSAAGRFPRQQLFADDPMGAYDDDDQAMMYEQYMDMRGMGPGMMPELKLAHSDFFNKFGDDFDDEDLK